MQQKRMFYLCFPVALIASFGVVVPLTDGVVLALPPPFVFSGIELSETPIVLQWVL